MDQSTSHPPPVLTNGAARTGPANGRWLIFAGVFHVAITLTVFALGRASLFPNLIDTNGGGRFASDSPIYLADAVNLVNQLRQTGLAAWINAPLPLHTKLYSLCFAALGPLVGFNIVAAEPLNLILYLAILYLVFRLGVEVFDARTGRIAAMVVALWPTVLLHTTQILKDPLFIALLLGLILVATRWLARSVEPRQGFVTALRGGVLMVILCVVKPDLWPLTLMIVLLSLFFQCGRFLHLRRILKGNLIGGIALLALALVIQLFGPRLFKPYHNLNPHPILTVTGTGPTQQVSAADPTKSLSVKEPSRLSDPLTRMRERIAWARYLFVNYPGTSSNVDVDVRLESWGEVIRYLPRAAEIGLLAPFPRMWFTSGEQVGRLGRLLSGLEMLLMYGIMILVLCGLWQRGTHFATWFLVTIAVLSVLALGLVTPNIGALYRMRYPFWILLIIVGVDSVLRLRAATSSCLAEETFTCPDAE